LYLAGRADGQVGVTTDILTGVVTDETGAPLVGAVVEAYSLETQITRQAWTDRRGRYTILFPDGGGAYRITARFLGKQPQRTTLQRYADEDRLIWDVRLTSAAVVLDELIVQGPPLPVRAPDPPTPGSNERMLTPDFLARLPVDQLELAGLAALVPGAVLVSATDSTAAAFSIAGLRLDANAFTLDGATFGGGSLPQDGLRNSRVVTSTYDVSRGQFSGGLIASTTRSGTNAVQGSSGYSLRDDDLSLDREADSPFTGASRNTSSAADSAAQLPGIGCSSSPPDRPTSAPMRSRPSCRRHPRTLSGWASYRTRWAGL
jgi:hypothetical protein